MSKNDNHQQAIKQWQMAMKLLAFIALFNTIMCLSASDDVRQVYIVYMGELPNNKMMDDHHHLLLSNTIGDETIARRSKIHSYGRSFNGFAARLLPHEAQLLSGEEGVVSVFPNKKLKLTTTRSWDFLGLPQEETKRHHADQSDTIVAVIDTGIWVDSPSFNDKGFGPPPKKWKGKCDKGIHFSGCNNKVIGAQFFNLGQIWPDKENTPADFKGHGTHTASTAAGRVVDGANVYGIASGTARGGVPSARIAIYKACSVDDCEDADILAAFDAAIADGVDLISVSLGRILTNFTHDSIAIGSFHAAKKGILTVCAAGNFGPYEGSVKNVAPWILTVAASTTDRKLVTNVKLGNGKMISGVALNTFSPKKRFYPLTNPALARNVSGNPGGDSSSCSESTLNKTKIKGKIVHCHEKYADQIVPSLGGAGTIMSDPKNSMLDQSHPTQGPATYVSNDDSIQIDKYINSTSSPLAVIFKTTSVNVTDQFVARFSSRGPQHVFPNILKPDIAAPGVDILAAYPNLTKLTRIAGDRRLLKFNLMSGTSMAAPHVAGAAAYVKTHHPRWSPAAIKSALMTTATPFKIKPTEAELATGSGQLNPTGAVHPGLVYDEDQASYVSLLCKLGYTSKEVALITGSIDFNCSSVTETKGPDGLNYPSIYFQVKKKDSNILETYYRTVTNIGFGKSVYKAKVDTPEGFSVKVHPNVLTFNKAYEKKSFTVTLKGKLPLDKKYSAGSLVWSDFKHNVRSPILVSYYNSSH